MIIRQEGSASFTKLYLGVSLFISALVYSQKVDPYSLTYTFKQTFFEFSLWRPFTAIAYMSRMSLYLPFHLLFGYIALYQTELKVFRNRFADLVWMTFLSIIGLMVFSSTFYNLYFFGNAFILILLVVWAVFFPNSTFQCFGIGLKSVYFPFIYPALMILLGSNIVNYIAGAVVGGLYALLKHPNFIRTFRDYFPTPQFLRLYFRRQIREYEEIRSRTDIPHNETKPERPVIQENKPYFIGAATRIG